MTTGHKSFPLLPANLSKSRARFLPNSFNKLSERNLTNLLAQPTKKKNYGEKCEKNSNKTQSEFPRYSFGFWSSQSSLLWFQFWYFVYLFCAFRLTLHLHSPKRRSTFHCLMPCQKQAETEPQTNLGVKQVGQKINGKKTAQQIARAKEQKATFKGKFDSNKTWNEPQGNQLFICICMHFPPAVWTAPLPMRRFPSVLLHDPNIYLFASFFLPVSVWSQSHFAGPSIPIPCHARPFFHFSTWPVGGIFTIFTVLALNFFFVLAFSAFVWVSIFVGFSVHFRAGIAFCRFQYAWLLAIWPSTLANWIRN